MKKEKKRIFNIFNDSLEVTFTYDEEFDMYFGCYPDFTEEPRYTPCGKPWVNVTNTGCMYTDEEYGDCGSCSYFKCEKPGDLIGVCENENLLQCIAEGSK